MNADFTQGAGSGRQAAGDLPGAGIRPEAAFGEMSTVLLGSQRVQPQKAVSSGYQFRFPQLTRSFGRILLK